MISPNDWNNLIESLFTGTSLFGYSQDEGSYAQARVPRVCPACGETESELKKTGLLGCAHCYDSFEDLLLPVFARAQGHTEHIKQPVERSMASLEQLKRDLKTAVEREAYEEAAKLRDDIRRLEADAP